MWSFYTRHKTPLNKVSFFMVDIFPSLFFAYIYNSDFIEYVLAFTFMYCLYEIGYISNDVVSVMNESKPTYRINENDLPYVRKNLYGIILIRLILAMFIGYTIIIGYNANVSYFLCFGCALLLAYYLHNHFRGRINIVTMFGVVFLKYFIPISIVLRSTKDIENCMLIIILAIVLPRVIEYTAKKKFFPIVHIRNIHKMRLMYMLFLFLLLLVSGCNNEYFIFICLLLFYRCICYVYVFRS